MVQTDLFKQLDLAINASVRIYWWQHPLAQIMTVIVLLVSAVVVIVWHRRRVRVDKDPVVQQLINLLYASAEQRATGAMQDAAFFLTISAILKRYTAWLVHDESVGGMTDQEWLLFIKNKAVFDTVIDDCERLVALLDQYKFSGGSISGDDGGILIESAYSIMAKTSSGCIAQHAGSFISQLKRDET